MSGKRPYLAEFLQFRKGDLSVSDLLTEVAGDFEGRERGQRRQMYGVCELAYRLWRHIERHPEQLEEMKGHTEFAKHLNKSRRGDRVLRAILATLFRMPAESDYIYKKASVLEFYRHEEVLSKFVAEQLEERGLDEEYARSTAAQPKRKARNKGVKAAASRSRSRDDETVSALGDLDVEDQDVDDLHDEPDGTGSTKLQVLQVLTSSETLAAVLSTDVGAEVEVRCRATRRKPNGWLVLKAISVAHS